MSKNCSGFSGTAKFRFQQAPCFGKDPRKSNTVDLKTTFDGQKLPPIPYVLIRYVNLILKKK